MDKATNVVGKAINAAQKFGRGVYRAILTVRAVDLTIIERARSALRSITSKAWTATLRVKDFITAPIKKITSAIFNLKTLIAGVVGGMMFNKYAVQPTQMYADYEDLVTQFGVLLGSQDKAKRRMQELVDFAGKTPFTRDQIFQASRVLQTYTQGALATPEAVGGLKMIGDIAASTGTEFERVATYMGQLYNEVGRGGESMGGPLMMLREIGALSAEAEEKIKEIATGSGTVEERWAKIAEQFSKTDGMMEAMSNQMNNLMLGVKSFVKNNWTMKLGEGISASLKPFLVSFRTWRSRNSGLIAEWATRIRDIAEILSGRVLGSIKKIAGKVQEIFGSDTFQDAGLGGKMKLLWKGLVTDPLSEWWDHGGHEKTAATAQRIGEIMGRMISEALVGIFTGIATLTGNAGGIAEAGVDLGSSVAAAFAKGFKASFDGGTVNATFKAAVTGIKGSLGNLWQGMPLWGKILLGGAAGIRAISGVGAALGGLSTIAGTPGKWVSDSVQRNWQTYQSGHGLAGLFTNVANALEVPTEGAEGGSGWKRAIVGAAATAGATTAVTGVVSSINHLAEANRQITAGENELGAAHAGAAGLTLGLGAGGALLGLKAGAAIGAVGGPAGALIGAGVGAAAGMFFGDKIVRHVEAAKYESKEMRDAINDSTKSAEELNAAFEKVKAKNLKEHFGDIALSLSEIQTMAKQTVLGDKIKEFEAYSDASEATVTSLAKLRTANASVEKILWKARVGYQFDESDEESIISAFDSYIEGAKQYVESQHYEFTAAISLLVDPQSEEGQSILSGGTAAYSWIEGRLSELGGQLSEKLKESIKIENGVLTLDINGEVLNLQNQINEILNRINTAQAEAESESIKIRFGGGKLRLDSNSFNRYQEELGGQIESGMNGYNSALTTGITEAKLRLNSGDPNFGQKEYDAQVKYLEQRWRENVEGLRSRVVQQTSDLLGEAYTNELGPDAGAKISRAIQSALDSGMESVDSDWVAQALGLGANQSELSGVFADKLSMLLASLEPTNVTPRELDVPFEPNPKVENPDGVAEQIASETSSAVEGQTVEPAEVTVPVEGKPEFKSDPISIMEQTYQDLTNGQTVPGGSVTVETTGTGELTNKEEVSEQIASQATGLPGADGTIPGGTVTVETTGTVSVTTDKPELTAADFGVADNYGFPATVNVAPSYSVAPPFDGSKAKFGIAENYSFTTNATLTVNWSVNNVNKPSLRPDGWGFRGGIFGGASALRGYADGGMVRGGARLIKVAEEGSPEMVIPLSSQRRDRGLQLWEKAGEMLGAVGEAPSGGPDQGGAFPRYEPSQGSVTVQGAQVDVGGVTVQINVQAGAEGSVADEIKAQASEIADTVAGILAESLRGQFQNMPRKGGLTA